MMLIIMTIILGAGEGALTTAGQAVRGDLAKQYPDLNSTYYALVISCLNAGHMIGYALAGGLLILLSEVFSEFWIIFLIIMLIIAVFQMASFGIFMTINRNDYEFVKHLDSVQGTMLG